MTLNRKIFKKVVVVILTLLIIFQLPTTLIAENYISSSQSATIGLSSVSLALLGKLSLKVDSSRTPLIRGPLPFEKKLQYFIGGKCYLNKTNFLDNTVGSIYTPVGAGFIMFVADLSWPQGDQGKTTLQDLYLYSTGLLATKGLTGITKGLVARDRPLICLEPELAAQRKTSDYSSDHHSFFSGHTSSAFFAANFVNKRLRSIMRTEMSIGKYKSWRWAPPVVLYGWASFVGWSRIHVWKHFLSDIIIGAAAGYLMSELFYSFGDDIYSSQKRQNNGTIIKVTFTF